MSSCLDATFLWVLLALLEFLSLAWDLLASLAIVAVCVLPVHRKYQLLERVAQAC